MGLFAIGRRAFGLSSGVDVKVGNDEPGPHRMRACSPVEGMGKAWGIMAVCEIVPLQMLEESRLCGRYRYFH